MEYYNKVTEFENILLDISIDIQDELLRQLTKVGIDDYELDKVNDNTIAIFDLYKKKYINRLLQVK